MSDNQTFRTTDGASIHYLDCGKGQTIVMLPGWSQPIGSFKEQYRTLSKHFRCIVVDMRGHGDSEDVAYGFSIERLAADLHELMVALDLNKPILLGHSMGASVIWRYFESKGSTDVSKMIFVDQAPVLTAKEDWTAEQCTSYGAIFNRNLIDEVCKSLTSGDAEQSTRELLRTMFTDSYFSANADWLVAENLKLKRASAATLLRDHCQHDWREVIKKIDIPCLVIGGRVSFMPWQSQQWIAENIEDSKLFLFDENEGGQHFMFMENPAKFNKLICNFCQ